VAADILFAAVTQIEVDSGYRTVRVRTFKKTIIYNNTPGLLFSVARNITFDIHVVHIWLMRDK